jgi:hypothetical protein
MDTQTEDIKGWRGTEWGMNKSHLQSLFKDEIDILEVPEEKGRNRICELYIENFKIHNDTFNVYFVTTKDNGELVQTILKLVDGNGTDFEMGFFHLERLLTLKYGKSQYEYNSRISSYRHWLFPSTLIMLDYVKPFEESIGKVEGVYLIYSDFEYSKKMDNSIYKGLDLV